MKSLSMLFLLGLLSFLTSGCATNNVQEEPKTPQERALLFTEMGTQALVRGESAQAIEDLRKAIVLDEKNAVAHNHLGLAYYSLGQKSLAQKEISQALKLNPNYSDAYVNLGNFLADQSNFAEAKKMYLKALDNLEYGFRHRALTNLAQLELRENNVDAARTYLYQSLTTNPDYCLSHFLLGSIFIRENNLSKASDEFKKSVVKTCAANLEGHFQLGLAYLKLKKYDKARSQFVFLVEEYPQSIQAQKAGDQLKNIP